MPLRCEAREAHGEEGGSAGESTGKREAFALTAQSASPAAERPGETPEARAEVVALRAERKAQAKAAMRVRLRESPPLVIDLGYDPLMTETERKSLRQQIYRCYGLSMHAERPYRLFVTGVDEETRSELEKCDGVPEWSADFVSASLEEVLRDSSTEVSVPSGSFRETASLADLGVESRENVVYLSADAKDEIEELDLKAVYVIGGLVDRNRHKGVAMSRAEELGIRSAQLPIRRHIKLTTSQALSVDQVFLIMLSMRSGDCLAKAADKAVPMRKRAVEGELAGSNVSLGPGSAGGALPEDVEEV